MELSTDTSKISDVFVALAKALHDFRFADPGSTLEIQFLEYKPGECSLVRGISHQLVRVGLAEPWMDYPEPGLCILIRTSKPARKEP
jgi:hypothetical protein